MGRWITCNGDIVWKYQFGGQPSEMYRIEKDLGIGHYKTVRYEPDEEATNSTGQNGFRWVEVDPRLDMPEGDVLILTKSDVPLLDEELSGLDSETAFAQMVKAIRDYVERSDTDRVELRGEF